MLTTVMRGSILERHENQLAVGAGSYCLDDFEVADLHGGLRVEDV